MKIIIAPDSFKESLSSLEVANAIENGFKKVFPDSIYIKIPIADGGEGTVESLTIATNGKKILTKVIDPLGKQIKSFYGICGDNKTVVIEMAAASGLHLIRPNKRNPLVTTSFGTGQLIKDALDKGYRKFIIGIGGSATNDAGAGMLQALGAKLLDENNKQIQFGGENLLNLKKIDISNFDKRIYKSNIQVACDVSNPLTGPNGASKIFGPQKGANDEMVDKLDSCLLNFANIVKKDFNKDIDNKFGTGAAGGLGASLIGFLGAKLLPGIEIIIKQTNFKDIIKNSSLVITGEGRIDNQSIYGKAPIGISKIAKEENIPVIAIAGSLGEDIEVIQEYRNKCYFQCYKYTM